MSYIEQKIGDMYFHTLCDECTYEAFFRPVRDEKTVTSILAPIFVQFKVRALFICCPLLFYVAVLCLNVVFLIKLKIFLKNTTTHMYFSN